MAVDITLKIEGYPGESVIKDHVGEIDVLAYSIGLSQSGTMHSGGGGGAGKAAFQDLSVTKYVDCATIDLLKCCAEGDHIPKMTLTVRKAGKKPLDYLVLDFEHILISSISTGGSGGEDRQTENITFNYRSVHETYTLQKEDGSAGEKKKYGFNVAENTEWSV